MQVTIVFQALEIAKFSRLKSLKKPRRESLLTISCAPSVGEKQGPAFFLDRFSQAATTGRAMNYSPSAVLHLLSTNR